MSDRKLFACTVVLEDSLAQSLIITTYEIASNREEATGKLVERMQKKHPNKFKKQYLLVEIPEKHVAYVLNRPGKVVPLKIVE